MGVRGPRFAAPDQLHCGSLGAMGPERRRQQRGLDAAVGRMLLTAALAAAGGGLVVLPAPGQYRRAASVAAGSLQGTAIVRELWRPGYSFALTLRGGGEKSKEASRKREGEDGDEEGGSREKKRARDENQHRKHTAASEERDQDETTSASDSADELAYDEAAAGGEHGGRVGAHNLGTLPPPIPAKHATLSKGAEGDDTTSESYPGCYSEESSDVVEEPVEARSGPLPTREELIRQIRDRPFNSSFVSFFLSSFHHSSHSSNPRMLSVQRKGAIASLIVPCDSANCLGQAHAKYDLHNRWTTGTERQMSAWPKTRRRPCGSLRKRLN